MGTYADKGQEADDLIAEQSKQLVAYQETITQLEALEAAEKERADVAELKYNTHMEMYHPVTPAYKTVIGSSTAQAIPGYDKVNAARVYLQPGDKPKSYLDGAANFGSDVKKLNPGGTLWVSAKDAPDTWLESFFTSLAGLGINVEYTQNHEFDNDGPNNSIPVGAQLEEYQRRWAVVSQIAPKFPFVKTSPLLLGHRQEADWLTCTPRTAYDHMGFDVYNTGIGTPKSYVPVAQLCDKLVAYAKKVNKPLVIGETGTGVVPGDANGAGRVKWTADLRAYMLDPNHNIRLACWWNQSSVTMDAATAKTWLG